MLQCDIVVTESEARFLLEEKEITLTKRSVLHVSRFTEGPQWVLFEGAYKVLGFFRREDVWLVNVTGLPYCLYLTDIMDLCRNGRMSVKQE